MSALYTYRDIRIEVDNNDKNKNNNDNRLGEEDPAEKTTVR